MREARTEHDAGRNRRARTPAAPIAPQSTRRVVNGPDLPSHPFSERFIRIQKPARPSQAVNLSLYDGFRAFWSEFGGFEGCDSQRMPQDPRPELLITIPGLLRCGFTIYSRKTFKFTTLSLILDCKSNNPWWRRHINRKELLHSARSHHSVLSFALDAHIIRFLVLANVWFPFVLFQIIKKSSFVSQRLDQTSFATQRVLFD